MLERAITMPKRGYKHRPARPHGFQFLYDGGQLLAVIERRRDGWHVFARGRNDIGTCADRESALRFANTITAFSS
jgi:hypothetical protein